MVKERRKSLFFFIGLLLFFLGMYAAYGIGIYNDSDQYITMHIHREPLYPLFLAFFRAIAGEDAGLTLAVIAQSILTACSIFFLTEYLCRKFSLSIPEELLLLVLEIMPHLVTKYVSAYGIFVENSIMSEALCMPLFQFFVLFTLRMIFENKTRDIILSLLTAWLLSMTRGQFMAIILVWMVIYGLILILHKQYRKLLIPILAVVCAFGIRSLSVHTYNYFITGYFMGNTYGRVNTLANVVYACDEEDGEVFVEDSLERQFFDRFYGQADEMGANYKYGGDTFKEQTEHLEEYHDRLKFEVLEAGLSAYFWTLEGTEDYYTQSRLSDETAGQMLKKLFPACVGQWLYDYVLLCTYGFIRSIAVVHPLVNWIAFLIYGAAIGLFVWQLLHNRQSDAVWVMGVALLFIAANVCATSITIMCLSRYMIYGFSLFYIAFYLLGREVIKENGFFKMNRGEKR